MYPANNGDAFLIVTELPQPLAILVDGGYGSTFNDYISPDLKIFAEQGYCLDLVVATHIDADHISGLLEFFKQNGNSSSTKIIPIKDVWHNSVRSLDFSSVYNADTKPDDLDLLTEIKRRGFAKPTGSEDDPEEISAKQGSSLAALLLGGNYRWNMGKGLKSINCGGTSALKFGDDMQLQVIAPQIRRLQQLKTWWIRELKRFGFTGTPGVGGIFDDAFEFLCSYKNLQAATSPAPTQISSSTDSSLKNIYQPDTSVTNSSSIAFIAKIGPARILFLGDAWAEDIELYLKSLSNTAGSAFIFDAIKVSHHGSLRNTSPALLELIDARVFLISSDGKRHSHPDFAVLKAIVDRPCKFKRNIYFNYTTPASRLLRNYKSKSGANFEIYENSNSWINLNPESL